MSPIEESWVTIPPPFELFFGTMINGENPSDGGCSDLEDAEHVAAQRGEFVIGERASREIVIDMFEIM